MAVEIVITLVGFDKVKNFTSEMRTAYQRGITVLFRSLGVALVENIRHRIISRNEGQWSPASKWARAKTGQNFPTLLGAEKYVKMSLTSKALLIYGRTGKSWTLTQHHEGFTNELKGPEEEQDEHGRVVLHIKNPEPLSLYAEYRKNRKGETVPRATVFAFKPMRPGVTPGRKIWPTAGEATLVAQPIASKWLQKMVEEAGGP